MTRLVRSTVTAGGATGAADDDGSVELVDPADVRLPGRVRLVAPRELPRRSWGSVEGRGRTVHALAHIEANAVNLALDALHRFGGMPLDYHLDWLRVAREELGHFRLLEARLADHGLAYGDLPCHGGLWDVASRTTERVEERMALVPMYFEARGLDVTPPMIERFERHGDVATADALRVVLRDEVGHVAVGIRWFRHVCEGARMDSWATFDRLLGEAGFSLAGPINADDRIRSGFPAGVVEEWRRALVG